MLFIIRIIISIVALGFLLRLYKTNDSYPIKNAFKTLKSSNEWLKTTIFDYYVQTLAFSLIVFSSEKNKTIAFLWILLNSVLGSPFSILYLLTKKNWSLQNI